jgi:hypothetical protein
LSLLAGVALLGAQSALARHVVTIEALGNFDFEGDQVVYEPDLNDLTISPQWPFQIVESEADTLSSSGNGDVVLYLSEDTTDSLEDSVTKSFSVVSTATSTELLNEPLESMRVSGREGRFDFLLKEVAVTGDIASQYADAGVYFKVVGLNNSDWQAISRTLALAGRERGGSIGLANGGASPAIPVPGTLALLLAAAVPLVVARRRRPVEYHPG